MSNKDPCAKFKNTNSWKYFYKARVAAIEKQANKRPESKKAWGKLNTCSRINLVDKLSKKGLFEIGAK
jgi:hypothetical protein